MNSKRSNVNHWLMKTEPHVFSIEDLVGCPQQTTGWVGVRNYQARNWMRDSMRLGDRILIYHSSCPTPSVVGIARVARTSHPDPTQWDATSPYFDPKSTREKPRWFMVDVQLVSKLSNPISIRQLREIPELADMMLLKRGMRLSIQPVAAEDFARIERLGKPEKRS